MPMLKFFMKYVLIYVPIIGLSWWALDMPFLKRYTKKQLEKNPNLVGKDVREMKRALKHYSLYQCMQRLMCLCIILHYQFYKPYIYYSLFSTL